MKKEKNIEKTAVAYYRYSSHKQGEQSIEGQADAARAWAEAHGYHMMGEYADRAQSGRSDDREQFQRMLRELEQLRPEVLLLWKVDRMGRNKEEIAYNKYRVKKAGVQVVYIAENIPNSPEGVLLESVMEGLAEYYSLQLAQNVKRGQKISAQKCQSTGGVRPLGYDVDENKKYVINPKEAPVVRKIFEKYEQGESQADIIKWLNDAGIKTTMGKKFAKNSLGSILKNKKYIGIFVYNDEIEIEGGVPPIVEKETWERVQEMLKLNQRAPAHREDKEDYILTGKLFCGKCGKMMIGISGRGKNGAKHCYYACSGKDRRRRTTTSCDKKNVRKEWIEEMVIKSIQDTLKDPAMVEEIAAKTFAYYLEERKDNSYLESLEKRKKECEKGIGNIVGVIEKTGMITDGMRQRLEELEEEKKQVETALAVLEKQKNADITMDWILYTLKRYAEMDVKNREDRKILIDAFVNSVYLYDDDLLITYNYEKNKKKIEKSEADKIKKKFRAKINLGHQAGWNTIRLFIFCKVIKKASAGGRGLFFIPGQIGL